MYIYATSTEPDTKLAISNQLEKDLGCVNTEEMRVGFWWEDSFNAM